MSAPPLLLYIIHQPSGIVVTVSERQAQRAEDSGQRIVETSFKGRTGKGIKVYGHDKNSRCIECWLVDIKTRTACPFGEFANMDEVFRAMSEH